MKKKMLQYGISTGIGLLIAFIIMYTKGLFVAGKSPDQIMHILSDAFFVPGVLIFMIGMLVWVSATGFFDSIGYLFSSAANMLVPFTKKEPKRYADYKEERKGKRIRTPYFMLIVGLCFIAVAAVFVILWSKY